MLSRRVSKASIGLDQVDNTSDATKNSAAVVLTNKTLTSPTLTTPTLGVATATTINKVTITAPATSATLTIPDGVTLTGSAVSGTVMTLGNTETVTGVKTFGSAGAVGRLRIAGTTSGTTILDAAATASGTLTLPAATDTLVGKATVDILTNKTLTTPTIASFTNATHGHTNAAGGGQLSPSTALSATGTPSSTTYLRGDNTWATFATGDTSTNTSTSVDSEIVLFNGTTGKSLKRSTTTGMLKATSGVLSAATAGTDYVTPNGVETLTNKIISGGSNTLTNIPQSAVTNLTNDLSNTYSETQWLLRRIGNTDIPLRRTNFATWADTSSPSLIEDTGQSTTHTGGLTSTAVPIIANGKWTIAATPGTGNYYSYRYFQESSNITRMGMRFSFDNLSGTRTTNKGTVVLVICTYPFDLGDPNFFTNFKFGSHLWIGPTQWGVFTYRADTDTFNTLGGGTFSVPLAKDGTIYEAEIYRYNNTLTIAMPDGTVKKFTNSEIGSWSTNWGWVEAAVDYHDTDNIPGIIEYWVDTKPQIIPLLRRISLP
ncbi:MAG: hypothetical protein WAW80_02615 [Candidatus Saccharimonadales bacterium]